MSKNIEFHIEGEASYPSGKKFNVSKDLIVWQTPTDVTERIIKDLDDSPESAHVALARYRDETKKHFTDTQEFDSYMEEIDAFIQESIDKGLNLTYYAW